MDSYIKIPEAMSALAQAIKKYVDSRPYLPVIERNGVLDETNMYTLVIRDHKINSYIVGANVFYTKNYLAQTDYTGKEKISMRLIEQETPFNNLNIYDTSLRNLGWDSTLDDDKLPYLIARRNLSVVYNYWNQQKMPVPGWEKYLFENNQQAWVDHYSSVTIPQGTVVFQSPVPFSIIYEVDPAYVTSWQDQVTPLLVEQNAQLLELLECLAQNTLPEVYEELNKYLPKEGIENDI